MQSISQISIPEPCSQQWQSMTAVDNGRYCDHCCKTVIDFTGMTNQQIIDHLSSAGNVCGRVDAMQLASINRQLVEHKHSFFTWKGFSLAASLFFALPVAGAYAQHRVAASRSVHHKLPMTKKITFKTISGVIRDSTDKSPLPGVSVAVKGTTINTLSDTDGKYSIQIPSYTDTLAISYTSYSPQNIIIKPDSQFVDIALTECNHAKIVGYGSTVRYVTTGGLIVSIKVKKAPFYKRWYYRFIKRPIKKIFG